MSLIKIIKKYFSKKNLNEVQKGAGFTLVEMMVVVAIVIVMTSILLLKQSKFSSDILVTNAAYEVALSIREAQVYGISSKQTSTNLNVGYGIYLDNSSTNSFTIYSDGGYSSSNTYNYTFNYGDTGESYVSIENPQLTQGQTIKKICVASTMNNISCSDTDSTLTKLNIGFIKPNPEALIYKNGTTGTSNRLNEAFIVVASVLGDKCRVVRITSIGQISVDTPRPLGDECTALPTL